MARKHKLKSMGKILGSTLLIAGFLCGCKEDNPVSPPLYTYTIPEQIDDGWATASLADVGLQEETVEEGIIRIQFGLYKGVHSVLIVKDGKLVLEEYFSGVNADGYSTHFDRTMPHLLASDTKSITSALVGIAIDQHYIASVDEHVLPYFPQYNDVHTEQKDHLTLEHFLTMSAGLQFDEWSYPYSDDRNDHVAMNQSSDPVHFALALPMEAEPGTRFTYNSGLPITLGKIVEKASLMPLDEFAETYLFTPLGISDYSWWRYPNGTFQAGGGLDMLPRDMAKFGYLYLNNGMWQGEQIISREWIEQSVQNHIAIDSYWNYGYLWWLRTYEIDSRNYASYTARGWGGQYIHVFPDLNMVVVFTGGNFTTPDPTEEILTRFILMAVL
ncbi:MAG: serine hydrolase [Deferribacteres bacterium]|nr:serine hydrolase [candidate division KSB1 bacterium]MCB9501051.1 serine hydrolase [Deferribacteres bacterium]